MKQRPFLIEMHNGISLNPFFIASFLGHWIITSGSAARRREFFFLSKCRM